MKKFAFTNQKYMVIKEKEYERLKLDMGNVDKNIELARAELRALDGEFAREQQKHRAACQEGTSPGELRTYQGYFEFIEEQREAVRQRIAELMEQKRKLTEQLVKIHNELKVLEQMRQEQYEQYCKEVAAEEARDIEEHISFSVFEKVV